MTNEEAKIIIGNILIKPEALDDCYDITEYQEAKAMAIKALDQQPCEDCISRTRLLARIDEERKHLLDIKMDGAEHIIVHHARRIIEDMPSVIPKAESEG